MAAADPFQSSMNVLVFRTPDQVSTLLQGEVVILNVKSGKYYNLNPVGSRIWELIEQPASILSIVDAIAGEYDVERERCAADVDNMLRAMHAAGLVEVSTDPPSPGSDGPEDAAD